MPGIFDKVMQVLRGPQETNETPATQAAPPETPEPQAAAPKTTAPEPSAEAQAAPQETLRDRIVRVVETVYDPEIPVNIYELGLVYRIDVLDEGRVEIDLTLTSPNCPVAESLPREVEDKVRAVEGVGDVKLNIVWDPPWTPEMMSDAARLELGMFE